MNESTKKVLIIAIGAVIIVIVSLKFIPQIIERFWQPTISCKDGTTVQLIRPEPFVLQYSGDKITWSVEFAEHIKQNFGIGDEVLQKAIEATQLLDQRLRWIIVEYNATACDKEGKVFLRKINDFTSSDFVRMMELQKEIAKIDQTKDVKEKGQLERLIKEKGQIAKDATSKLSSQ